MLIKIIRNIFSSWISYFITIIIGLFLSPFVVHALGNTQYGIWSIVGSLTGYLGLFDFGIRISLVKYVSQYRAHQDFKSLNQLFNTSFAIYLAVNILLIAICFVLPHLSTIFFNVSKEYYSIMQWTIFIMGVNIGVGIFCGLFAGILAGSQRYDILSGLEILLNIISAGLTVWLLSSGGGIIELASIALMINVLRLILNLYYAKKENRSLKFSFNDISKKTGKTIGTYSSYMFLLVMAVRVIFYTDYLVIGVFLPVSAVTFYAIGANLIEYLRAFVSNMTNVFNPVASEYDARGQKQELRNLLIRGTKYTLYIALPCGFGLIVFGKPFITLWMGAEYQISSTVLIILMIPQFMAMSQYTSGAILNGLGKHKFNAIMASGEAIVNLILSLALVRKFGIMGVAFGTLIPLIVTQTFILPAYTCRTIGLELKKYLLGAFSKPIILTIPYLVLLTIFRIWFYPNSWFKLIVETGVLALFFLFLVLIWGVDDQEIEMIPFLRSIKTFRDKFQLSLNCFIS